MPVTHGASSVPEAAWFPRATASMPLTTEAVLHPQGVGPHQVRAGHTLAERHKKRRMPLGDIEERRCSIGSNHPYSVYPNLIRDLVTTSIDQVWLSDITYIRILTDLVYLAVIFDRYSRKTLRYAISSRIDTELTLRVLKMALRDRQPPRGCIHHSDRGGGSICCP